MPQAKAKSYRFRKGYFGYRERASENTIDYRSARMQVMKNDAKYPTVSTEIAALPTTVPKPIEQFTEADIRYNLTMQLVALAVKEGWQSNF